MLSFYMLRSPVSLVAKSTLLRGNCLSKLSGPTNISVRQMANPVRSGMTRRATRSRTIKEIVMAPAGDGAFNVGKGMVVGASALGLGALCFYGLGFAAEPGAIDRSMIWPEYVKERIRTTYMYFGGSLAFTAVSAVTCFRSPTMMNIMMKNSWMAILGTVAVMIASSTLVRSIPYKQGLGAKQAAWALHSAVVGAVIAPMCFLGGPLLLRAALYTAGIVGGLSTVAVCAPSEKFLYMGGPLAIGLGAVFAASIGSAFLPPTTALGAGLYSIALYGGLVLFSGFLLYNTQRIVHKAEHHPMYAIVPYDPVNASIGIYMDTINIFVRIATILAGGGNRRK